MRSTLLAVFVVCIIAAGCGQLTSNNAEYTYEMKTYTVESRPGCGGGDTIPCASFSFTYPRFNAPDSSLQMMIDERIASLVSETPDEGSAKSIQELGQEFIRDFNEFVAENPELALDWNYAANVSVMIATDTLISLQVDSDVYTGGAHGLFATRFVNVDPKTGTAYLLDALLRPGYPDILTQLAYEDLQRQRGDKADSSGISQEEDAAFTLNDNYGFRKEGIVFFYNVYEIGPYADGPTEILIPYERLVGWIK